MCGQNLRFSTISVESKNLQTWLTTDLYAKQLHYILSLKNQLKDVLCVKTGYQCSCLTLPDSDTTTFKGVNCEIARGVCGPGIAECQPGGYTNCLLGNLFG